MNQGARARAAHGSTECPRQMSSGEMETLAGHRIARGVRIHGVPRLRFSSCRSARFGDAPRQKGAQSLSLTGHADLLSTIAFSYAAVTGNSRNQATAPVDCSRGLRPTSRDDTLTEKCE